MLKNLKSIQLLKNTSEPSTTAVKHSIHRENSVQRATIWCTSKTAGCLWPWGTARLWQWRWWGDLCWPGLLLRPRRMLPFTWWENNLMYMNLICGITYIYLELWVSNFANHDHWTVSTCICYLFLADPVGPEGQTCDVAPGEKIDCGVLGTTMQRCITIFGCCWKTSTTPGEPWCYGAY